MVSARRSNTSPDCTRSWDRFTVLVLILMLVSVFVRSVAFGQVASGESQSGSLLVGGKKVDDLSGPTIEILEPAGMGQRGMKSVAEEGLVVTSGEIKIRGLVRGANAIAVVKVQGKEADLRPTGDGYEFSSDVLLEFGPNSVSIEATDIRRKSSTLSFKLKREVPVAKVDKKVPQTELFKGRQVWAAVIGVSEYQNPKINPLRYADRDAEAFYQYLITPIDSGGRGVPEGHIRKLLNKEATRVNIVEAFKDFMRNTIDDDIAIIYFAGHGMVDPAKPTIAHLLAYDTDISRLGATAVRMSEIQESIRDYIKAGRIIVFADACHSAAVGADVAMRDVASAETVNKFLEDIAKSGNSILTFSASEANETSQEGPRWGGGHGVFTFYLLEGLKGKANIDFDPTDPFIRLGRLVDYVESNVKRDTQSQQHASHSQGTWDRNLPMSIATEKSK
ncbi:MAG: caspase family protein [Ignavibacteriales bacterium]|nr:caspase family protein [Ignavibacteriales bacterium]